MTFRDILLALGDWIQLAGLMPSLYFVIDYGVIRPQLLAKDTEGKVVYRTEQQELVVMVDGKPRLVHRDVQVAMRRFQPWRGSWLGIMFFSLGLAFCASGTVVGLSLWLGPDYPFREYVRILGYLVSTGSIWLMAIVYTIERNTASSVLVPPARH